MKEGWREEERVGVREGRRDRREGGRDKERKKDKEERVSLTTLSQFPVVLLIIHY